MNVGRLLAQARRHLAFHINRPCHLLWLCPLADGDIPLVAVKHLGLAVVAQRGFECAAQDGVAVAVYPSAEDAGVAGELAAVALQLDLAITER